jgi:cellulase/cellobiase CelA1
VKAAVKVDNKWTNGYCARVDLTNNRTVAITGWTVALEVGAATVQNSWSGTFTKSGTKLTVTPAAYNKNLAVGAATNFGFCMNFSGTYAVPTVSSVTSTP